MKHIERRHLKESELVTALNSAQAFAKGRGSQLKIGVSIAVVVFAIVLGISMMRSRSSSQGTELLGDALAALNARVVPVGAGQEGDVPAAAQIGATGTFRTEAEKLTAALPKLQAAADAYPTSDAGVQARYFLGGALSSLGRADEAIKAFDLVVERAGGDSMYGQMARLGKADAQARAGQLDEAIATWKALAGQASTDLPVDAILMELARAYVQKGNTEEARKTFAQLVEQHPNSSYASQARQELDNLKG